MKQPIVFLDFDGVIRCEVPGPIWSTYGFGTNEHFIVPHMERVAKFVTERGMKIVLSTAWNNDPIDSLQKNLEPYIPWELMHEDYRTPAKGSRDKEVKAWLDTHSNPEYIILEDIVSNFEKADDEMFERIVWCAPKYGFTPERLAYAEQLWENLLKNERGASGT